MGPEQLDQKINIIKKDLEDAMTKLYQEMGQTLARLANNIAADISNLEARIKKLEDAQPREPRDLTAGGREL